MNHLTTEKSSNHDNLENLSTRDILLGINQEDKTVANAVEKVIPQIEVLVDAIYEKLLKGGRLFYIGSGTSGRLGILDASECPPTFGVPFEKVIGLIAGGDSAIRKAVENAEDDEEQAENDLKEWGISENDIVIGISASGRTPYVKGGLLFCKKNKITTASISCNQNSEISTHADFPIEVEVGPEFVTGSTRMKSGTAQKLILNMISTSVMIKLGYVKGNKMINMQLTNAKLRDRGVRMIKSEVDISDEKAAQLLDELGSVRKVLDYLNS
jgi:N-acetylmuramic acid 6-phosphate etherase